MYGCTYAIEGAKVAGKIYGEHAMMPGDVMNTPASQEAYEAGRNC